MSEEDFSRLVEEIKAQGYTEEQAAEFATIIGDTPMRDGRGEIVVMQGARVLARLRPLKFFEQ